MKKFLFCLILFACEGESLDSPIGCFTGVRNGKRELLKCDVEKDYYQNSSSLPQWPNHTQYKWEQAKNCQECNDKYK
jgi:hypothetical protein